MRSYLLSFWNILLDPLYYFFTRLEYLDRHSGIFRVRLTKYKGREVLLSDGTVIKKNDKLVKIHLHNVKLLSELKGVPCSVRRGRIIFRKVLMSIPLIAEYIHDHKERNEIKGVIGITMLYKGAEKLGFETFQPCHPLYRLFKRISQPPLYLLSAEHPNISKIPDTYYLYLRKSSNKLIIKLSLINRMFWKRSTTFIFSYLYSLLFLVISPKIRLYKNEEIIRYFYYDKYVN